MNMSILDQIKDVKVQVYDLCTAREHLLKQVAEIDRQIDQRNHFIITESQRITAAGEPLATPEALEDEKAEAHPTEAKTAPAEEKVELPEKQEAEPDL